MVNVAPTSVRTAKMKNINLSASESPLLMQRIIDGMKAPAINPAVTKRMKISEKLETPTRSPRMPLSHGGTPSAGSDVSQVNAANIVATMRIEIESRAKFNLWSRTEIRSSLDSFLSCSWGDVEIAAVTGLNKTVLNAAKRPNAKNTAAAFLRSRDIYPTSCTNDRPARTPLRINEGKVCMGRWNAR